MAERLGIARAMRLVTKVGWRGFILSLLPFAFYYYTACPTIGMGDTAILLDAIHKLNLTTHVNNHPMTVFAGWVFSILPFDDLGYKGNLMSATFGAITIIVFFVAVRAAIGSLLWSVVIAGLCMVSHSMWWHSTIIENYCFNALFTALYLLMLVKLKNTGSVKFLYGMFFITALALANHVQMTFFSVGAAGCLLVLILRERPKSWLQITARCCLFYFVGLLPWIFLFILDCAETGSPVQSLQTAFLGSFGHIMMQGGYLQGFKDLGFLVLMQVPSPFILVLVYGIWVTIRNWGLSKESAGLWLPFILTTGFFMTYNTWDKFAFLLPSFLILLFVTGSGVAELSSRLSGVHGRYYRISIALAVAASFILPPLIYAHLSAWGESGSHPLFLRWSNAYTANTHRSGEYIANPNKRGYYDVHDFITRLFAKLPPYAFYIDDDSRLYYPVEFYQKHYGMRPDLRLKIINSWDIPGWGLNRASFQSVVRTAHDLDGNLFLVTIDRPFSAFFTRGEPRFGFHRFHLDEDRWIYKLITAKESKIPVKPTDKILRLTGEKLSTNILRGNVAFHHGARLFDQNMSSYGTNWRNNDQLFVQFGGPGSSAEFVFNADSSMLLPLVISLTTAPHNGVVKVVVNGEVLSPKLNLYSPQVLRKTWRTPEVRWKEGKNSLVFEVVGKDAQSTNFFFGIDTIEVSPDRTQ